MDKKIIVLQGPPCGGKSTLAQDLHKANNKRVIICRDSIREARGTYWLPEQEEYISRIEEFEVREAINQGLTPIIDATNLNPKTINKWENLAKELDCKIAFKECVVPYEEACKRDKQRGNKVGKAVITNFYKKYYPHLLLNTKDDRKIADWDPRRPEAIIIDLDSVIALRTNRLPDDYAEVKSDIVDPRMQHLFKNLLSECPYQVFFIVSRPISCKEDTIKWIDENIKPQYWDNCGIPEENWKIYFSNEGNLIGTNKEHIYKTHIAPWFNVVAVFDNVNTSMWRKLGLLCLSSYE